DWHHIFQVNFFAPIMLARGLVDELKAAKGSVVNVTSIAGSRVHPFAGAAYSTSKAALAALTREMASDFGRLGIRVNAIAPGEIDTVMLSPGTEKIVEQIPMHRLGTTDEVAKIIYVLCTDTGSYVNGAEIHINGGQHVLDHRDTPCNNRGKVSRGPSQPRGPFEDEGGEHDTHQHQRRCERVPANPIELRHVLEIHAVD